MNVLVTGAEGFIGKNLVEALKNIRDGKDRTRPELKIDNIFRCGRGSSAEELAEWCGQADFVFHLAGINRPKDPAEFKTGNADLTGSIIDQLRLAGNTCPVMLSSSAQASLTGRYAGSPYGQSKLDAENLVRAWGRESGAKTFIYRFPNVFGKWCRPNYNSAIATFCHNIANGLPITVNDRSTVLETLYIDDLVRELLDALEGHEHRAEKMQEAGEAQAEDFCAVPVTHTVSLGEIADLLDIFRALPQSFTIPDLPEGSFAKKLYSTYLSYLPEDGMKIVPEGKSDPRGSFTELLKTPSGGQFSLNVSHPGITKGMHWHHSKWEIFWVISGQGLMRERKIGSDEVREFRVSGDRVEGVIMLPGYTHELVNLSETEELVTLMWANEMFDPNHPDTYFEKV